MDAQFGTEEEDIMNVNRLFVGEMTPAQAAWAEHPNNAEAALEMHEIKESLSTGEQAEGMTHTPGKGKWIQLRRHSILLWQASATG